MNKEIMKAFGFESEVKLVEEGKCPFCQEPIKSDEFRDELSRKEYVISGMCQKCQDKTFDACPLGGDIRNDCADCAYAGEYSYDEDEEECLRRENTD
jgi:hypothetical protein